MGCSSSKENIAKAVEDEAKEAVNNVSNAARNLMRDGEMKNGGEFIANFFC